MGVIEGKVDVGLDFCHTHGCVPLDLQWSQLLAEGVIAKFKIKDVAKKFCVGTIHLPLFQEVDPLWGVPADLPLFAVINHARVEDHRVAPWFQVCSSVYYLVKLLSQIDAWIDSIP